MKISTNKITTALFCLLLITVASCDNEPFEGDFNTDGIAGCQGASQATAQAAVNFTGANVDNYSQVCTAYKAALIAQITACGDVNGVLQTAAASLGDCTQFTQPDECAVATTAVGAAQSAFDNATTDNYAELCSTYRTALENLIDQCGANADTQSIIDGLEDCSITNEGNAEIEGTWKLTSWLGENPIDLNNDGEESLDFLDEIDCYNNETLVFNADGTGVSMSTSYATFTSEVETGTTNSFDFFVECTAEVENTNFTWTDNGSQLTVTIAGDAYNYTVDGNELSIFVPSGFVAMDGEDFTVTVNEDLTFIYTKQ